MHDVLDPRDLVPDEAEQLVHSGFPARDLLAEARKASLLSDLDTLAVIRDRLAALQRPATWPYDEPSAPQDVWNAIPAGADPTTVVPESVSARISGAWLGRCVGNTMGKPVEGLTPAEVGKYLEAVGQRPQTGYLPLLDPLPEGVSHLHESAPFASAGLFDAVPRDDDIDWTILGLHMLETYGSALSTADIAREWLDRIPFTQTFTAERAAYRNLVSGLKPPATATANNPYREWIGALIRTDIYGYVHPGRPRAAARMALTDAVLSHTANGIYGAMWAAALVSEALVASSAPQALEAASQVLPRTSRLYESQQRLLTLADSGAAAEDALQWIDTELGHYNWVHTVNNAAIITTALLWGGGDFVRSIRLAVRAGNDTDSTAATTGSVIGALHGASAVPERLVEPTHGLVRSAVRGFDRIAVTELAQRTDAVRRSLESGLSSTHTTPEPEVAS
ncbi:ADP-ribosylglycohydrolase family protein [Streptomyces sp. 35G-GA-8]|uniref:ADP-ribosylglycohydrolase family protein n=1 Tax=Streptomyces sp. 35G-GA-8 TaxID=2939434 RepID=UPI00201F80C7|nr:ADP-ribosylglycohydrolase family protein [Streptomyces sp. 35G-GA-8]MCL7382100.1 ADP-ribosylglycohydrolase family protein [Streptomyces sp. 35G-GA-8]